MIVRLGMAVRAATVAVAPIAALALTERALAEPPADDVYEAWPAASLSPSAAPAASVVPRVEAPEAIKQGCLASFKRAQRLRKHSQLLSARAELVACGQPQCPDVIELKCLEWVEEVRAAIPTIIVSALTHNGLDIADAELAIDDEPMATSLDGTPIDLDPGPHTLKVTHQLLSQALDIVAVQSAKNRVVQIRFAPPPRAPTKPPPKPFSLPAMAWIGFGLGTGGVLVGSITGAVALVARQQLECPNDTCFQYQEDELDSGRALANTSTASFSVAAAGAIVGFVGLLVFREPEKPKKSAITPLVGPGSIAIAGVF
jgi:hypothetical protein